MSGRTLRRPDVTSSDLRGHPRYVRNSGSRVVSTSGLGSHHGLVRTLLCREVVFFDTGNSNWSDGSLRRQLKRMSRVWNEVLRVHDVPRGLEEGSSGFGSPDVSDRGLLRCREGDSSDTVNSNYLFLNPCCRVGAPKGLNSVFSCRRRSSAVSAGAHARRSEGGACAEGRPRVRGSRRVGFSDSLEED